MKDFIKFTLATVTGLVLTGVVFFFMGIVSLFGLIAASEQETPVKSNSVFVLRLDKPLKERAIDDPMAMLLGGEYESMGLDEILKSIKKAKNDDRIRGIYIETGMTEGASMATWQEMRQALEDFKESGKFIIAYGDNYTQGEYYLCSVADKVILNPQGTIEWSGLSAQPVFYTGLLEKLGVKMQIFKVGTYKSAVEPFTEKKMSTANREQVEAYLVSMWEQLTTDVAVSRGLTSNLLNDYADQMVTLGPAEGLVECGLADTLLYMDGVKAYLKQLTGMGDDEPLNTLDLTEMTNVQRNVPLDKSGNIIAVYYATGEITDEALDGLYGGQEVIAGSKVIADLSRLREDKNVKAVVLRVNSPGGSAFASEQIWNEVVKLKAKKPVIVSMGGMAASGGYYISCAADSIFAEPTTLTGSIGIFGMVPDMQNLLSDKLGLDFDVVKTNRYSDIGTPVRPMNESEKKILQNTINKGYDLFVKRCADGRGMSIEALRQVAEGRVWTGTMALELGLVDKLGGMNEALQAAAFKAGTDAYTVLSYPEQPGLFANLMEDGKDNYINARLRATGGKYYEFMNFANNLLRSNHIQARISLDPNIKL
ncbi:MAG: signal peptide peptidase SppA [Bacteroidaceae bacterium]|nr:signal peptide peptidase SppA [Bacteroidaceae bacterium]